MSKSHAKKIKLIYFSSLVRPQWWLDLIFQFFVVPCALLFLLFFRCPLGSILCPLSTSNGHQNGSKIDGNRSRKQPNYHATKMNEKTIRINTFLSPLSYKSVQTVEAKRLFSHFHLSCNKLAQETKKRPQMEPKWSQRYVRLFPFHGWGFYV